MYAWHVRASAATSCVKCSLDATIGFCLFYEAWLCYILPAFLPAPLASARQGAKLVCRLEQLAEQPAI